VDPHWRDRAFLGADAPVAQIALGAEGAAVLDEVVQQLDARAAKAGIPSVKRSAHDIQRLHRLSEERRDPLASSRPSSMTTPRRGGGPARHGQGGRARFPGHASAPTVEEKMGRDFDLQELHINLISLTGHVDETDDELTLSWNT
jgi:hypothetical protein